jgi:hypothetical protein
LPITIKTAYTVHKSILIIIAATPSVIIISLKYETATTLSISRVTGFRASILPMKIKSKKAMLQMMANLEKKETTFIKNTSLKLYATK